FKFQRVGWAKRSVPRCESACRERRVGAARRRAFAHPTLLLRMANRGWKPKAWLRVLSSRGNERRVRVRYEGRTHDNSGRDAGRPSRARGLSGVGRPQRRTDDRQARGHSRPPGGCEGHAVAAPFGAPAPGAGRNGGRGGWHGLRPKPVAKTTSFLKTPKKTPPQGPPRGGSDTRPRGRGPPAGVTPRNLPPKIRAVCPL